jgi:hypothetical protein
MYQRDQGDQRYAPPAPDAYAYRGNMPVYRRPNQDRLATTPDDQMQYWWAQRYGIPQERP